MTRSISNVGELGSTVERLLGEQPEFQLWHSVSALIALDAGNLTRAAQELHHVVQGDGSQIARDFAWAPTVMCAARVAHGLGSTEKAQTLHGLMAPYSGHMSWAGAATFGPFDLALSLVHETMGDEFSAARHRSLSNTLARRLGCVSYER